MENVHIDVRVSRQCHDGGYFLVKLTQIFFLIRFMSKKNYLTLLLCLPVYLQRTSL